MSEEATRKASCASFTLQRLNAALYVTQAADAEHSLYQTSFLSLNLNHPYTIHMHPQSPFSYKRL